MFTHINTNIRSGRRRWKDNIIPVNNPNYLRERQSHKNGQLGYYTIQYYNVPCALQLTCMYRSSPLNSLGSPILKNKTKKKSTTANMPIKRQQESMVTARLRLLVCLHVRTNQDEHSKPEATVIGEKSEAELEIRGECIAIVTSATQRTWIIMGKHIIWVPNSGATKALTQVTLFRGWHASFKERCFFIIIWSYITKLGGSKIDHIRNSLLRP